MIRQIQDITRSQVPQLILNVKAPSRVVQPSSQVPIPHPQDRKVATSQALMVSPPDNLSSCSSSRTTTPRMIFTPMILSPPFGPTSPARVTSLNWSVETCSRLLAYGTTVGQPESGWQNQQNSGRHGRPNNVTPASATVADDRRRMLIATSKP